MVTLQEVEDMVKSANEILDFVKTKSEQDGSYAKPEEIERIEEISAQLQKIPEEARKTAKEQNLKMDEQLDLPEEDEEEFVLLQFTLEMFKEIIITPDGVDNQQ